MGFDKLILIFMLKYKGLRIVNISLKKKKKGGFVWLDIKIFVNL